MGGDDWTSNSIGGSSFQHPYNKHHHHKTSNKHHHHYNDVDNEYDYENIDNNIHSNQIVFYEKENDEDNDIDVNDNDDEDDNDDEEDNNDGNDDDDNALLSLQEPYPAVPPVLDESMSYALLTNELPDRSSHKNMLGNQVLHSPRRKESRRKNEHKVIIRISTTRRS